MNRAQNRSNSEAENYCDSLVKLFVDYKNDHSACVDGKAVYDKEVNQYRLQLELQWKMFCESNNQSNKRVMLYKPEAFWERIKEHTRNHNRLAWISALNTLVPERYKFQPELIKVFETFEQFQDIDNAALHLHQEYWYGKMCEHCREKYGFAFQMNIASEVYDKTLDPDQAGLIFLKQIKFWKRETPGYFLLNPFRVRFNIIRNLFVRTGRDLS